MATKEDINCEIEGVTILLLILIPSMILAFTLLTWEKFINGTIQEHILVKEASIFRRK